MRTLKIREVRCQSCGASQSRRSQGSACAACGDRFFRVEVERHSFGLDSDAIVDSFLDYSFVGGGEVRVLADLASGDTGGSVFYRNQSWVRCRSVSAAEIAAFLKAPLEDQARLYVSWKRREFEADLPRDRRLCARCKVAFKAFDNQWHQSGLCSRACLRASR